MYDPNFLAKDPQDPQFIAKVRNPCTFLSQIRQYANLFTPSPALCMAVSVGLMASTMSLFRSTSPTNDFPAIDTAELINLPLSLDEQITHKKIFLEEHRNLK